LEYGRSTKRIAEKSEVASGRGIIYMINEFDLVLTLDKFHSEMYAYAKLITDWCILVDFNHFLAQ